MSIRWTSTFTVASVVVLIITSPIARGESRDMNQEDWNVQQTTSSQTRREVMDYWTPERMRNAKPLMLTAPDDPSSVPHSLDEQLSEPSVSAPGSDMEERSNSIQMNKPQ